MSKKILVVDDDPVIIKMLSELLMKRCYQVNTAKDGLDAMLSIKKDVPDLILLDVMLPEINGYDVCYQLRFNKDYAKIPIILLTRRDDEIGEDIGHRVNIEYVHKPIDTARLLGFIEQMLSGKEGK